MAGGVSLASLPTVMVDLSFAGGASISTYLHLGDSARGKLGTGTLGPDLVWTDVAGYVRTFRTQRGSTRAEGPVLRYDAGTATVVLDNRDRRFDPANLDGPYVSGGATEVTPMRAMRIRAVWDGSTYDLWRGFADGWEFSYKQPSYADVTLTGTDGFKVLAANDRAAVAATGSGEDAGARVNRILNSAGWSSTDRVVSIGDTTVQATTLDGPALDELQLTADTEVGELYCDGAGRLVFRNRKGILEDARSNTSQATFGGGSGLRYSDVTPQYDDTGLANVVRITAVDGTEQTVEDATSETAYLVHTYTRSGLIMQTDAEALSYAGFVKYMAKDPELRFATIVIRPQRDPDNLYPQVLDREIGDRITIICQPPGEGDPIIRDVFIRGIQHEVTVESWVTTWTLQSATRYSFLVLDNSALGELNFNAVGY